MDKKNRDDAVDVMVKSTLGGDLPDEVRARLGARLAAFRQQLPYRGRKRAGWSRLVLRSAGAMAAAVLVIIAWATVTGEGAEPTWAQVAERFASVRFLSTTIYVKSGASASPVQLDLWMGRGGRLRLLAGNEVFFGRRGKVTGRVPFATPPGNESDVREAREMVYGVIAALGEAETFSLETLVEALPLQTIISTPLANQDARIANDLVVFDMADETSPAWLRIWALRDSRLPVRMRYWDPRTGESVDVVLSYAHEQPARFFDAEAYKAALAEEDEDAPGRAYALLKDPGGRPVTPADL